MDNSVGWKQNTLKDKILEITMAQSNHQENSKEIDGGKIEFFGGKNSATPMAHHANYENNKETDGGKDMHFPSKMDGDGESQDSPSQQFSPSVPTAHCENDTNGIRIRVVSLPVSPTRRENSRKLDNLTKNCSNISQMSLKQQQTSTQSQNSNDIFGKTDNMPQRPVNSWLQFRKTNSDQISEKGVQPKTLPFRSPHAREPNIEKPTLVNSFSELNENSRKSSRPLRRENDDIVFSLSEKVPEEATFDFTSDT